MALVSDWIQLGTDVFYRKPELYSMEWDKRLNLDDFHICAAPFGGPIALVRKDIRSSVQAKPLIFIFSASGIQITSFKWSNGHLVHVDWSRNEELVCIQEDGAVLLYDIFGVHLRTFGMGQQVKDTLVKEAQVFTSFQDTGIAILTKSNRIFVVNSIKDPSVKRYPDISSATESTVQCWCVVREDRQISVLVCAGLQIFRLLYQEQKPKIEQPDMFNDGGKVVCMALSANYRRIALYCENGIVWIGSSDLSSKDMEFNTKSTTMQPKQMVWCSLGAVILLWDMTLEVVGVSGDSTTIYLDSRSHLIEELDSVRIISSVTHDILHKVPHVMVDTLGIGSMAPGALLFEASQGYQEGSTKANDCLGMIKDSMKEAIMQCYHSASHEFTPSTQKALLRAALFGKTFVTGMDPESCRVTTTTLRILNAIRDYRVGIPLTWKQLEWLTIPVLIDRLIYRRLFSLALKIASYLKLPELEGTARILAHWACYKVKQPSQKADEQIAKEINAKLGYTPGISYTDIAQKAEEGGRKALAIKLVEYECRPSKQVPVLLRLGEDLGALRRALHSGDTDLIHNVLPLLRRERPQSDFLMLIRNFPIAKSLYIRSCREGNIDKLRDVYIQDDDFYQQGLLRITEAYKAKRIDSMLASLQGAFEDFKQAKSDLISALTEDQIKLMKYQIRLEEIERKSYVNKSLYDTFTQLVKDGQIKEAEKLKVDFKISEKRYCVLRIMAHAEANHWNELTAFSKHKKLAIGFETFVSACIKYGERNEARKYLPRVKEENKVKCTLKCGLLDEALQIVAESKSVNALQEVASACMGNPTMQRKIQALSEELFFKS